MKKVFLMMTVILAATSVFAQKGLHVGLVATPGTSWMFNKADSDAGDEWNYVPSFGIQGGLTANYHFTDGLGVGIDVQIAKHVQNYESYGYPVQRKLNYVKIPLLVHFNTSSESVGMFVGKIGPSFNFLTGASEGGIPTKVAYNSTNVSFVLGFGAGFNITEYLQATAMMHLEGSPFNAENEDIVGPVRGANPTRNAFGGLEIGLRYVLRMD